MFNHIRSQVFLPTEQVPTKQAQKELVLSTSKSTLGFFPGMVGPMVMALHLPRPMQSWCLLLRAVPSFSDELKLFVLSVEMACDSARGIVSSHCSATQTGPKYIN